LAVHGHIPSKFGCTTIALLMMLSFCLVKDSLFGHHYW